MPKHCSKDSQLAKYAGKASDHRGVSAHGITSVGLWHGPATTTLVESLLHRGTDADHQEAQAAIEWLAAIPTDPGFVMHELPLLRLRALLARAHGDEITCRELVDRYRTMANTLGFEGFLALADAMT